MVVGILRAGVSGREGLKSLNVVQRSNQTAWGFPAALNFVLGGAAAGWYLVMSAAIAVPGIADGDSRPLYPVICAGMAAIGFIPLALKTNRMYNALYLFNNIKESWVSREALSGLLFIFSAAANYIWPHGVLEGLAVLSAAGFLVSQGFMPYQGKAVSAWRHNRLPWLLISAGLYGGAGFLTASVGFPEAAGPGYIFIAVLILSCAIINAGLWISHIRYVITAYSRNRYPAPFSPIYGMKTVFVGHILPMMLLLVPACSLYRTSGITWVDAAVTIGAAVLMIAFSAYQKIKVVKTFSGLMPLALSFPADRGHKGD